MNANKFIARLNVNKAKASKNSPTSRIPNATTTLRHDEFWKFGEQEFSKNFRPPSTKERTVSSCPFRILLVRCIIVYENFVSFSLVSSTVLVRRIPVSLFEYVAWFKRYFAMKRSVAKLAIRSSFVPAVHRDFSSIFSCQIS